MIQTRFVVVALLCGCAQTKAASEPSDPTPDLSGVWFGAFSSGNSHQGDVVVRKDARGAWSAGYRGERVRLEDWNGWLEGRFDAATLRVRAKGDRLEGHWIQTRLTTTGQPFATPLRLTAVEAGVFRGAVHGLPDHLRFYVVLSPQDDGYAVVLRNPEQNLGVRYRADHVMVDGETLVFTNASASAFTAKLVGDTFHAELGDYAVTFTRVPSDDPRLAGFHLRPPNAGAYRYQVPTKTDDGWATGAAPNPAAAEALVNELSNASCTRDTFGLCPHAVVVAHRGRLVLESYFAGYDRDTPHDTRSAGKSWATTAVGAAVDRGQLTVEAPLEAVLSGYVPFDEDDARKKAITVAHLLTMSAGFACDDNDPDSPGQEGNLNPSDAGHDFARFIVDLPMARHPGERAVYCSSGMYLLSPVLEASTNAWSVAVLDKWLLRPLGITHFHLNLSPDLRAYFGGGIHLRPRDMAKLGQVFVDDGRWNGAQVVSRAWVAAASRPRARINAEDADDYGYGWWVRDYAIGEERVRAVYASGNGGQLIVAVPARQLVVVFTGGNYMNYGTWRAYMDDVFPRLVLPAFEAPPAQ
ncbi:MAG: serine hydrolase [Deltaproteobacteria bacterium]